MVIGLHNINNEDEVPAREIHHAKPAAIRLDAANQ